MIERHLGDDTSAGACTSTSTNTATRTPITTDLWDALEVASGQPVRATMGTWVDQAGHPLVSVELADGGTDLLLSQRRFLLDGGSDDDRAGLSP